MKSIHNFSAPGSEASSKTSEIFTQFPSPMSRKGCVLDSSSSLTFRQVFLSGQVFASTGPTVGSRGCAGPDCAKASI